jgi:hypothetical protein
VLAEPLYNPAAPLSSFLPQRTGLLLMTCRLHPLVWPLLLVIPLACRGMGPSPGPPGTMRQQQLNASVHDPYPEPNAGPEVVGGRPRDYQKPLSEPARNRFIWERWWTP